MKNLILIIAAVCCALFTMFMVLTYNPTHEKTKTTPTLQETSNSKNKLHNLNILFIGNSYTFFNNMPDMILQIAQNDPNNPYNLYTQSITFGGARLQDHWNNKNTHNIIEKRKWDIIVLQEQSQWALYGDMIKNTAAHVALFSKKAKQHKSFIMIYQTWPRQPHTHWYTSAEYKVATRSPEHMFNAIKSYTAKIASKNSVGTAPVGEYWYKILNTHPEINLYENDGTHPSMAGSYLAALVFYKYLTGNSPMDTSYIPKEVPKSHGEALKRITSEKL